MNDYKKYLLDLNDYETVILNIGDGFAVTRKKQKKVKLFLHKISL
jgi:predicted O-methyltransferase YrrM